MDPVTIENRKAELRTLLGQIESAPSRDWSRERQRVVVLQQMVAADEQRRAPA